MLEEWEAEGPEGEAFLERIRTSIEKVEYEPGEGRKGPEATSVRPL